MGTQGDRIFRITAERGFPDPWLSFGDSLCDEARYATEAMRLISTARKDPTAANQEAVAAKLQQKADNIQHCADILAQARHDYDRTGMWEQLDEKARQLNIPDVLGTWARTQELHPYPMVLRSLEFNWTYMKEHGVRAFYEMTSEYVGKLIQNTATWQAAWEREATTGTVDRITSVECDLNSIEAPMHCDVCKKTVTALLYLDA